MAIRSAVAIVVALAATPVDAAGVSAGRLRKGIEKVLARPAFAAAWWGIDVRSLASGKVLYSLNATKNLKPASALKLVTTAAVLDAFGPDDRVRTSVETAGRLDAMGRILGDVYLVGRGDPTLGRRLGNGRPAAALEALVDALRTAGIRRVEGRLVGHEGLFTGDRRGADWTWEDLVWSYGAEVSALSFNGNSADLLIGPGEKTGDPLVVERSPASSYYQVSSTATTSGAGSEARLTLFRAPGANLLRLSGTLPAGQPAEPRSVALEDPARYAATVFGEVLEKAGIVLAGPVETSSEPLPADVRVLTFQDSEPLAEILKTVNKESRNLHAEMLLRQLGARVQGAGTAEAGLAAARAFLARVGVRSDDWSLQDGSGLSRSDTVSAGGLVDLLAAMDKHRHALAFRESLAVAGVDGTLEDRMKGTPAQGRILAKSGSLRHVNALAGYALARGGERLAFAIVVNHHSLPGRDAAAAIDAICTLLVE